MSKTKTEQNILLAEHEIFKTERLLLRKIELADATDLFEFDSDPEVARYVMFEPHESIEKTRETIVDIFAPIRFQIWGIVDKVTNKMIGTIDLRVTGDKGTFGWALSKKYWGQGIMPEAARVLRNFAFDTLELNVLESDHVSENKKSGRVMEKIGMKRLGQFYMFMEKENKSLLADYWAMTRDDYLELKK